MNEKATLGFKTIQITGRVSSGVSRFITGWNVIKRGAGEIKKRAKVISIGIGLVALAIGSWWGADVISQNTGGKLSGIFLRTGSPGTRELGRSHLRESWGIDFQENEFTRFGRQGFGNSNQFESVGHSTTGNRSQTPSSGITGEAGRTNTQGDIRRKNDTGTATPKDSRDFRSGMKKNSKKIPAKETRRATNAGPPTSGDEKKVGEVFPGLSPSPTCSFSTDSPLTILLPYQREWVNDDARFKIGLWARQTGKSFACAAEAVRDCLNHDKTMWVVLSAGERQALEFMEKARQWAEAFKFAVETYTEDRDAAEALIKSAEIRWQNGSRMLALPANPNTARGYSANLILDEFAFHENPDKIWRGIYPSITNPLRGQFKLRIVSTANGKGNKFYDLWTKNEKYSKHLITIHRAVELGLPLNVQELKEGLDDPDGWAQEYECQFIDTASILLPYDLIATCESEQCFENIPIYEKLTPALSRVLYAGVDIGRKHDLTVIWLLEKCEDVLWTRRVEVLERTPFREQLEIIEDFVRPAHKVCIDATGIGAMLAEELGRKYGEYKVEQCQFTAELKQEIFTGLRRKFEDKLIRVPISRSIREDLHGLQKVTTTGGTIRYIAPHNEDGHCDRATALALAVRAASSQALPGRIYAFERRGSRLTDKFNRAVGI